MFQLKKVADGKVSVSGLGIHKQAFDLSQVDWKALAPWLVGGGLGLGTYALSGIADPEGKYRGRRALLAALAGVGGGFGYNALANYHQNSLNELERQKNAEMADVEAARVAEGTEAVNKERTAREKAEAATKAEQAAHDKTTAERDQANAQAAEQMFKTHMANQATKAEQQIGRAYGGLKALTQQQQSSALAKLIARAHAKELTGLRGQLEQSEADRGFAISEQERYAQELADAVRGGYLSDAARQAMVTNAERAGAKRGMAVAQRAAAMDKARHAGIFGTRDDLEASTSSQLAPAAGEHIDAAGRAISETGKAITRKGAEAKKGLGRTLVDWGTRLAR